MPSWASLYLIVVALIAAWATVDDVRSRKSMWWIVADIAAIGALGVLFVAHFVPALSVVIGPLAAPLFAVGFAWTGYSTHRDIMALAPDPELSSRANLVGDYLGMLAAVVVFAPLIGFAAVAAARTL